MTSFGMNSMVRNPKKNHTGPAQGVADQKQCPQVRRIVGRVGEEYFLLKRRGDLRIPSRPLVLLRTLVVHLKPSYVLEQPSANKPKTERQQGNAEQWPNTLVNR
jgi:hypothetical protein